MACHDYLKLLNREVDGLTSPEEEAALMAHIANCPACEEQQRWQHRIHRALAAPLAGAPPADLARRVADRVLADAGRARGLLRPLFGTPLRLAASVLVVVGLAGVGGFVLGTNGALLAELLGVGRAPVSAGSGEREASRAARRAGLIRVWGVSPARADRIMEIQDRWREARARAQPTLPSSPSLMDDIEAQEILRELSHPERGRLVELGAVSREELERLLALEVPEETLHRLPHPPGGR
jgi:hypothetical protein